jgi:hypothetical protein
MGFQVMRPPRYSARGETPTTAAPSSAAPAVATALPEVPHTVAALASFMGALVVLVLAWMLLRKPCLRWLRIPRLTPAELGEVKLRHELDGKKRRLARLREAFAAPKHRLELLASNLGLLRKAKVTIENHAISGVLEQQQQQLLQQQQQQREAKELLLSATAFDAPYYGQTTGSARIVPSGYVPQAPIAVPPNVELQGIEIYGEAWMEPSVRAAALDPAAQQRAQGPASARASARGASGETERAQQLTPRSEGDERATLLPFPSRPTPPRPAHPVPPATEREPLSL